MINLYNIKLPSEEMVYEYQYINHLHVTLLWYSSWYHPMLKAMTIWVSDFTDHFFYPKIFYYNQTKEITGKVAEESLDLLRLPTSQAEKAMAPHSSTLAWNTLWTEEPGRLQSMGSLRVGHNWATSLSCIGEGNGNPLQCSCLENPRDVGAWRAAVYGVTQSRTRLKWLSSSSTSQE